MKINKRKIFDIIQINNTSDFASIAFDVFIAIVIGLNLFVTLFGTFDESIPYTNILKTIECITIIIFWIISTTKYGICIIIYSCRIYNTFFNPRN